LSRSRPWGPCRCLGCRRGRRCRLASTPTLPESAQPPRLMNMWCSRCTTGWHPSTCTHSLMPAVAYGQAAASAWTPVALLAAALLCNQTCWSSSRRPWPMAAREGFSNAHTPMGPYQCFNLPSDFHGLRTSDAGVGPPQNSNGPHSWCSHAGACDLLCAGDASLCHPLPL
jgi:hypothetical protein